ncbi:MAG TPA: tripartite tricarboxylate transporter TctB family protein [Methylomirabilota bacterium]|nr:tripartite tricarboxylate transporter TctB family protein [Methylomirabilota bacterium]
MRAADLITAGVLMLLGGAVVSDAVRLGVGWGVEGPRSGFFPFWLAMVMLATCAAIVVQSLRRAGGRPFVTRAAAAPVLAVLLPAVAMVLATQFVGLYVASGLYMGFYMRWVGRHAWPVTLGLAVAIPVVTFLVFERWFLVPMPKGPLETWLGY